MQIKPANTLLRTVKPSHGDHRHYEGNAIMTLLRRAALFLAVLLSPLEAGHGEPPAPLPAESRADWMAATYDNSVEVTFRDDSHMTLYFEPDGTLLTSFGLTGRWAITEQSELCLTVAGTVDCNAAAPRALGDEWEQTDDEGNWARIAIRPGRAGLAAARAAAAQINTSGQEQQQ